MIRSRTDRRTRSRARRFVALAACLALVAGTGALAADDASADWPELVTDRPDQTESTSIVPRGAVQIETGIDVRDTAVDDVEALTLFGTLARYGLSKRFELRAGVDGWISADRDGFDADPLDPDLDDDDTDDGLGDASVGFKVALTDPDRDRRFEQSLLAGTTLPVGDDAFTSDRADPFVRWLGSIALDDTFSLGVNAGAEWATERDALGERDTLASGFYSASLGIALTERVGTFVEAYGSIPLNATGGPANGIDFGLTWRAAPRIQWDVSAGFGLSDAADDAFIAVGASFLIGG